MLGIRKLALTGARVAARSNRAVSMPIVRNNATNFDSKERGEEAVYFQGKDAQLKAEMRAKIEQIMALEDTHEEKQDLVGLLSKF